MAEVYAIAHIEAARIVGGTSDLTALARDVRGRVRRQIMARAFDTGEFHSTVKIANRVGPYGVRDRVIYSDDPAALAIEYGHLVITRVKGARRVRSTGAFVPGKYPFTAAFQSMKGEWT
ncbi:DUF5403 family protein [Agromyces sp. NPDC127015]|uniref:DUF5403 family protein n=1 Tax=Agromyces sp. NPDC127015 TaxID=3347108 RepID=UPI00366101E5